MRKIKAQEIKKAVYKMIYDANFCLPNEARKKIKELESKEKNMLSKSALEQICENFVLAEKEKLPLCQDTGAAIFFIEIGHEILLDEPINKTIEKSTEKAYLDFYLRKSIVKNPLFDRKNTNTNCPPFIHLEQVKGDKLKITFLPKGGGAENKSALKMLTPSKGEKGVIDFVIETVKKAGGSACPPFLIGIGIGGTFDSVATLAKKAIIRGINSENIDKNFAKLEQNIYSEIEKLNIGAMGLSGKEFLLGVNIEQAPCHIASLPVSVNIQCHSARMAKIVL